MFNPIKKYRSFHAYNRYNYPVTFMVLGCGKTLLQVAVVFAVALYGLPMLLSHDGKSNSADAVAQVSSPADLAVQPIVTSEVTKKVEVVPAVAKTETVWVSDSKTVVAGMYNGEWLLNQKSSMYVVQLASSTDKKAMYQKALDTSNSFPSVVFPFKSTRSGRVMYGYSLGLFESVEDAQDSIAALNGAVVKEGIWIWQVGELQQKIRRFLQL